MNPITGVIAPARNQGVVPTRLLREDPDLARAMVTYGRQRRAGHRETYEGVDWGLYRAHVGVFQRRGPWHVEAVQATEVDAWVAEAEGLPHEPGWYTALIHDERGLVMSDLPGEIAGTLDFLERARGRVLIHGLGLGIVPAALLAHRPVTHVDVVELDADVIALVTEGADEPGAPNAWAADPRLHVHHGDAFTFRWPAATRWDCCLSDVWDRVTAENLSSMRLLLRRFRHRVGWHVCWERAECLGMQERERREKRAADPYAGEVACGLDGRCREIAIPARGGNPGQAHSGKTSVEPNWQGRGDDAGASAEPAFATPLHPEARRRPPRPAPRASEGWPR